MPPKSSQSPTLTDRIRAVRAEIDAIITDAGPAIKVATARLKRAGIHAVSPERVPMVDRRHGMTLPSVLDGAVHRPLIGDGLDRLEAILVATEGMPDVEPATKEEARADG